MALNPFNWSSSKILNREVNIKGTWQNQTVLNRSQARVLLHRKIRQGLRAGSAEEDRRAEVGHCTWACWSEDSSDGAAGLRGHDRQPGPTWDGHDLPAAY